MLIALTILLLGGGGSDVWLFPEDFTDKVEMVVVEEKRQAEILDLFDKITQSVTTYNDRIQKLADQASQLNRNPEAGSQDFESMIENLLQERKKLQTEVLEVRLKMVLKFEQSQWEKVFAAEEVGE